MPRVFISYRQSDAQQDAGNLFKALDGIVGYEEVFLDKFGIKPGAEFSEELTDALHDSDIVSSSSARVDCARRDNRVLGYASRIPTTG